MQQSYTLLPLLLMNPSKRDNIIFLQLSPVSTVLTQSQMVNNGL